MSKNYSKPLLYVRSSIFLVCFAATTIVLAFPVVFSFLFPLMWRWRLVRIYPTINLWLLKVICGLRYRVEGRENVPSEPSVIFCKHQSTWETLGLTLQFPPAVYVAKRELLYIPFFGWGAAALRFITIDRSAGRKAVEKIVEQARDRIARGLWVIIFPEGTRRPVGAPPNYKLGGAVLATEVGVPIVPVAVNAGEYWPRHSLIKWPGEVVMSIGPPIYPEGKSPEQVRDEAQAWIEGKMAEITVLNRFPY
ncbi:MAG: lysophospholipid acyltransferase family protein [Pseudomonadota bacterium]